MKLGIVSDTHGFFDPQLSRVFAGVQAILHGGDVGAALKLAQAGRRGLPNLANTADTLGWAYYRFGAYDSAVDSLREAVKGNPKSATYHYHLGLAYKAAGNADDAKKELESTLKLSPNFSEAPNIKEALAELKPKS